MIDEPGADPMMSDLKTVVSRARSTFLQDVAGMGALSVILVVGLYLPGLI